jgi:hypothetical protein
MIGARVRADISFSPILLEKDNHGQATVAVRAGPQNHLGATGGLLGIL